MVVEPVDFFDRRTGRLCFDIHIVIRYREIICSDMAELLSWQDDRLQSAKAHLEVKIEEVTQFGS
jgi:glycerol-3-phosphate dehydrogenase